MSGRRLTEWLGFVFTQLEMFEEYMTMGPKLWQECERLQRDRRHRALWRRMRKAASYSQLDFPGWMRIRWGWQ